MDWLGIATLRHRLPQPPGESASRVEKRWCAGDITLSECPVSEIPGTYNVQSATTIMDRHVSTLADIVAIRKELAHEVVQREAPLLKDACLAVLREDDIGGG